jgi:hypothetical protein
MNSNEDNIGTQCYNVFYDKKKPENEWPLIYSKI